MVNKFNNKLQTAMAAAGQKMDEVLPGFKLLFASGDGKSTCAQLSASVLVKCGVPVSVVDHEHRYLTPVEGAIGQINADKSHKFENVMICFVPKRTSQLDARVKHAATLKTRVTGIEGWQLPGALKQFFSELPAICTKLTEKNIPVIYLEGTIADYTKAIVDAILVFYKKTEVSEERKIELLQEAIGKFKYSQTLASWYMSASAALVPFTQTFQLSRVYELPCVTYFQVIEKKKPIHVVSQPSENSPLLNCSVSVAGLQVSGQLPAEILIQFKKLWGSCHQEGFSSVRKLLLGAEDTPHTINSHTELKGIQNGNELPTITKKFFPAADRPLFTDLVKKTPFKEECVRVDALCMALISKGLFMWLRIEGGGHISITTSVVTLPNSGGGLLESERVITLPVMTTASAAASATPTD
jgi:hypothetical protein